MHPRLFIVDRDTRYGEWLRRHLGVMCPDAAVSVVDAAYLTQGTAISWDDCDLLLLVASFGSSPEDPASEGLERLRQLRARPAFPPVIAIADEGNELTAVRAVQLGALDYLPKRLLTPERLKTAVRLAMRRVERRVARRAAKLAQTLNTSDLPADAVRADEQEAPLLAADLIPGYTIGAAIGESEKAVVHRAMSTALGRDVALKISKSERSEGQLLAREYVAVSALRHPAIVQIHDYGTHAGREYLAMELFPCGDLKARLQQGVTEEEAMRYLELIASALRVVHGAGLLHRDLKPPNVMLRENDEVALIDFGLARNLEGGLQSTHSGVLRGSPYYMSPEQALGEPLDPRTDIYSLGIIFFEMLTGRKPFTGTSAIEVLQEHVNAPVPVLPPQLAHQQSLLARLLAKSRDDRFASADEILAALAAARDAQEPQTSAA